MVPKAAHVTLLKLKVCKILMTRKAALDLDKGFIFFCHFIFWMRLECLDNAAAQQLCKTTKSYGKSLFILVVKNCVLRTHTLLVYYFMLVQNQRERRHILEMCKALKE